MYSPETEPYNQALFYIKSLNLKQGYNIDLIHSPEEIHKDKILICQQDKLKFILPIYDIQVLGEQNGCLLMEVKRKD